MLRSRGSAELLGTLAYRLMFPSTRTEQVGGTDLERHHDKSRSVCSSTSDRFADGELCLLEFPVLVGLGRSERGAEALPGARLPCCRCCTRRLQISWNRDPRPASRRRWADGWARSCCPSRNRHGARSRNSSWAGCWPAVGTSRRRSWP